VDIWNYNAIIRPMKYYRIGAFLIILLSILTGYFIYSSEISPDSRFKFKYGLDLNGGTSLTYRALVDQVDPAQVDNAMSVLRDTIERRINPFSVSEPVVQTEVGSSFSDPKDKYRLVVEIPGVTDTQAAIDLIGQTPLLEFRLLKENIDQAAVQARLTEEMTQEEADAYILSMYQPAVLTGGNLARANLVFDPVSRQPLVTLDFDSEGSKIFEKVTGENIGKEMAIFLDGQIISNPVIQTQISGGTAQINGNFTPIEARDLVNDLNFGALPVPIELINTQVIGPALGQETLALGTQALILSVILIVIFMMFVYRLPGIIAGISLIIYVILMLLVFKTIPVVLTSAGIAGFVLSLGMAVDANVLVFERIKEELDRGVVLIEAIKNGFAHAWSSIRDGNITSIISAVILYWFSDVSLIKGFALVFGFGVMFSMLCAMVFSKILLLSIAQEKIGRFGKFLYSKGLTNIK
jgi:preprotein translocase subunit SecD